MTEIIWRVILFMMPVVMVSIVIEAVEEARVCRAIRKGKLIVIQDGERTIIGPSAKEEAKR